MSRLIPGQKDFATQTTAAEIATLQASRAADAAAESLRVLNQQTEGGAAAFGVYGAAAGNTATSIAGAFDAVGTAWDKAISPAQNLIDQNMKLNMVWSDSRHAFVDFATSIDDDIFAENMASQAIAKRGDATADATKKTDAATKAAQDFQEKMEQIASNERIKTIEAKVNLNIEQIKAEVAEFQTTWKGIDDSIGGSVTLLGDLYKDFTGATGSKRFEIEDWIEKENNRRDALLKLQIDQANASIALQQARAAALQKGDAIIKVDGSRSAALPGGVHVRDPACHSDSRHVRGPGVSARLPGIDKLMEQIALAAPTFDPFGSILLEVELTSDLVSVGRRLSRTQTLDGGASIVDGGFSDADRTLTVQILELSADDEAVLRRLWQLYPLLTVCTREAVFLAAPERFDYSGGTATLRLLVKQKLSA